MQTVQCVTNRRIDTVRYRDAIKPEPELCIRAKTLNIELDITRAKVRGEVDVRDEVADILSRRLIRDIERRARGRGGCRGRCSPACRGRSATGRSGRVRPRRRHNIRIDRRQRNEVGKRFGEISKGLTKININIDVRSRRNIGFRIVFRRHVDIAGVAIETRSTGTGLGCGRLIDQSDFVIGKRCAFAMVNSSGCARNFEFNGIGAELRCQFLERTVDTSRKFFVLGIGNGEVREAVNNDTVLEAVETGRICDRHFVRALLKSIQNRVIFHVGQALIDLADVAHGVATVLGAIDRDAILCLANARSIGVRQRRIRRKVQGRNGHARVEFTRNSRQFRGNALNDFNGTVFHHHHAILATDVILIGRNDVLVRRAEFEII
ncbi:hypothetical protein SmphiM12_131 [Sinorhizobium phage phiM12]|uniref:Uncharacterized protein n=1 Tax=Sinorhizobium phage phiM12 TaxID=1357423 RepID=S5MAW3_9CAUD|nr:hypothetical protein AB690_gp102 [Sinorhizobium phage phiM12]AGR47763.1 hypothetical protein SmphiM12_131 [Sinorhizobium phage phiM12]